MINLRIITAVFALLVIPFTMGSFAYAGHEANGGYGIANPTSGRIISLDLAMRGSATNSYAPVTNSYHLLADEAAWVDRVLRQVASETVRSIVKTKLAEFKARADELPRGFPVRYLITNALNHTFILQTEMRCLNIQDDDSPYHNKVQLAYRVERNIRFCQGFERMDDANKAGLIVHEIIYAAHREKSKTVELVGFLFNDDFRLFDEVSRAEFSEILDSLRPYLKQTGWNPLKVSRLGTISAQVMRTISPVVGESVCFGEVTNGTETEWNLWFTWASEACRTGVVYPVDVRALKEFSGPGTGFRIDLGMGFPAGLIDPTSNTLLELCTGLYRACKSTMRQNTLHLEAKEGYTPHFVEEIIDISPPLAAAWQDASYGLAGKRVCAGKRHSELVLWLNDSDLDCDKGWQPARELAYFQLEGGQGTKTFVWIRNMPDFPAGEVDVGAATLTDMCSGEFSANCTFHPGRLWAWGTHYYFFLDVEEVFEIGARAATTLKTPEGFQVCAGFATSRVHETTANTFQPDDEDRTYHRRFAVWLVRKSEVCSTGRNILARGLLGWALTRDHGFSHSVTAMMNRLGEIVSSNVGEIQGRQTDRKTVLSDFCTGSFDPTGHGCTIDWNAGTIIRNPPD